jgi:hemoglobin/transferrin/lactoferrin receptor protein
MKHLLLITIQLFFFLFAGIAQTVTIVDSEDLSPVADVVILNGDRTRYIFSGRAGETDISDFREETTICFQHFSYERICLSFEELAEAGFEVKLTKKIFAIDEYVVSASRREQSRFEVTQPCQVN